MYSYYAAVDAGNAHFLQIATRIRPQSMKLNSLAKRFELFVFKVFKFRFAPITTSAVLLAFYRL